MGKFHVDKQKFLEAVEYIKLVNSQNLENLETIWNARQEEIDDLKDTIIQLENQNESLKGEIMFLEERTNDHSGFSLGDYEEPSISNEGII